MFVDRTTMLTFVLRQSDSSEPTVPNAHILGTYHDRSQCVPSYDFDGNSSLELETHKQLSAPEGYDPHLEVPTRVVDLRRHVADCVRNLIAKRTCVPRV